MPLFEFKCKCGNIFEKLYSPTKAKGIESAVCTKCGKVATKILSKTGAPQFVGAGFYATDYQQQKG